MFPTWPSKEPTASPLSFYTSSPFTQGHSLTLSFTYSLSFSLFLPPQPPSILPFHISPKRERGATSFIVLRQSGEGGAMRKKALVCMCERVCMCVTLGRGAGWLDTLGASLQNAALGWSSRWIWMRKKAEGDAVGRFPRQSASAWTIPSLSASNTHSHTHAHTLSHGTRQLHCHHTQSEKEREWNWGRESKRERRGLTAGMEGRMRWRCPPFGYEPGEKGWLATFLDGSGAPMISLQSGIAHQSRLSASMAIWTKPPARYSRMGKRFCPLLLTCWMRVRMSWPFRFASFLLSPFSFPILRWRLFIHSVRRRGLLVLAVCLGQALLFTCRVCVCVCVCVCGIGVGGGNDTIPLDPLPLCVFMTLCSHSMCCV